ncbi:MAG: ribonuclease E/G, partial [Alphaproteobacteria bacterium]|nr:ribonuclease E/G [Alphaproteobacteria bacterium]
KSFDAALDAVYLDLDGDNTGLLYNKDVRIQNEDGSITKGGDTPITKIFRAGQCIAVQAKTAYLPREYDDDLKAESKLPQMSMDITLPGRYLIYAPLTKDNRLSQRIRDKKLRQQMHKMLDGLEGFQGYILRAAAADTQTDMLMREAKILRKAWEQMKNHLTGDEPGLIMLGPDAVQRALSDQAGQLIDTIEVVTMDHYEAVEEWCSIFAPDLVTKIAPIEIKDAERDFALFEYRDIIGQIEDLFHPYVLLPGGGNIIIQPTAALTAIDVNRGGDKRSNLAINIEAAQEAARQLRLRNLGGIIMIDFLKSPNKNAEGQLIAALEEALRSDPCTVQMHGLTSLGLMELARKRRTPPLSERLDEDLFA